MATGYTHGVKDGTVTKFNEFAWECARAFGALVLMRDDPHGTPIPERFEPNTGHYDKDIARYEAELAEVEAWSTDDAIAAQQAAGLERVEGDAERDRERHLAAERYNRMIAQVEEWEPPSDDHQGLKDFMLEQLTSSMQFDCTKFSMVEPDPLPPAEYKAGRVAEIREQLSRTRQLRAEEIERTESRNEWLRLLRESVPPPVKA